nr:Chain P, MH027 [synthetic construct]3OY5_P Chain P, MH027 [synthetic construct]
MGSADGACSWRGLENHAMCGAAG